MELAEKEDAFKDISDIEGCGLTFLSPVTTRLTIKKEAKRIFVKGDAEAKVRKRCTRCLKEFEKDKYWEISFTFVPSDEDRVLQGDKELSDRDLGLSFLKGNELDTTEILKEQIALEIPIRSLCKEDCKGLCTKCGFDLNLGECSCSKEKDIDPRFSILKDFKRR